jgi:hypothetical protein
MVDWLLKIQTNYKIMKLVIWNKIHYPLGISSIVTLAFVLGAGCVVQPDGRLAFEPVVIAPAPVVVEPAPPAPVFVPDTYVWDGYEYVGIIGDQYFYLGPGNVWLVCEPFRLERFQGWVGAHPDWRYHAIRNDRYRTDRYGHVHPQHNEH